MPSLTNRLTEVFGLIPVYTAMVYIAGYVAMTAYLQKYGINEITALDVGLLKVGFLYAIIVGPAVLLAFATFKYNDFANTANMDQMITDLHDASGYTILYAFAITGMIFRPGMTDVSYSMLGVLLVSLIMNKAFNQQVKWVINVKQLLLLVPFFGASGILIYHKQSDQIILLWLIVGASSGCIFFRIFNKPGTVYQISKYAGLIITFLLSVSFFGTDILEKVPAQFGGEQKAQNSYQFTPEAVEKLKVTDLKYRLMCSNKQKLRLLYQTDDQIYVLTSERKVIKMPGSFVDFEEIEPTK